MNRILFEPSEISDGIAVFGGARARHIAEVLHGEPGQIVKTGVVDGLVGSSVIESIEKTEGEYRVTARVDHSSRAPGSWVDIILAPPRPRALKRLLPQLAAMGVGRIILTGAKKVEKDFWGATLLKEENYRPLLVDGLMQAGTSELPVIETRRNFRRFVEEELESVFSRSRRRVVAHPYGAGAAAADAGGRLLLAVGPEGGWIEDEVDLLEKHGFARYSLGPRILRTDTALIALLAKLDAACACTTFSA